MNMNERVPIKVIIVDDHPVVRAGIRDMLSVFDDIELVGEAAGGQELLAQIQDLVPDVILLDMVMPYMNGLETTRAVLAQYPTMKIVILTTFANGEDVQKVLDAGAVGYMTKHSKIDVLADAIRTANAGQIVLAPQAATALMESRRSSSKLGQDLTKRELEVLALLVEGLSNREIALRLKISPETVKHHVSSCMSKLEATNRTQAATLAIDLQLIPRQQG
jgi:two-component system, NarL family, response regulator LiaR